jgi:hypothetical protein
MQSEPGWPRIILGDTPPKAKQREECPHTRPPGEEGANRAQARMRGETPAAYAARGGAEPH